MGEIENQQPKPKVGDAKGILKQNREFLDFFWDIAKPDQEVRLKAIDCLVQHLKKSKKVRAQNLSSRWAIVFLPYLPSKLFCVDATFNTVFGINTVLKMSLLVT